MLVDDEETALAYATLSNAECWVVIPMKTLAMRFGPYTPAEAKVIMLQAEDEGLELMLVANCGKDFDWTLARDVNAFVMQRQIERVRKMMSAGLKS